MRWDITDRYGNPIYMTNERWLHAQEKRPWLAEHLDEVLTTLRKGRRQQDPLNSRKYKYYWPCHSLGDDFNHLVVIVLFGERFNDAGQSEQNNYVVNIWAVYLYGNR